jgi:hypothetical protein
MTGTATVGAETLLNSRIPEDDYKFPAIESIETYTTSMKSNDATAPEIGSIRMII